MTERARSVAVKGALRSRPSAGAPPYRVRGRLLTESAAGQSHQRTDKRLKKKTTRTAKMWRMNSLPQISKTASRQKLPLCGFASRENRLERRTASRVWARRSLKLASAPCQDQETGTHYNMARDYDPLLGRYGQSDPIGLRGGLSTYAYTSGNPLLMIDPSGLRAVTGAWITPPKFNIQRKGFDGWKVVSPSWSWWGYLKFIRVNGHVGGYVNVDVKCKDDCNKEWEIHNRISVDASGEFDVGPNVYAMVGGFLAGPYVGISINILMAGGSLLQAEHHFLSLAQQKAAPTVAAVMSQGPTAICQATGN